MNFDEKYNSIKNIANDELKLIEQKITGAIALDSPLQSKILEFLKAPSKRIRPLFVILYLKSCQDTINNNQSELLAAVELVHNASLIHDDIIDQSGIRRGRETIHSVFGKKLGVISGDYVLSLAMEKISKFGQKSILEKFSHTFKQMCIGEIIQDFNRYKIPSIEEYIEKSKNKTAYLFETALVCCAQLGEKSYDIKKLSDFALNFGIAFQIRDDLINIIQSDNLKPANNDINDGIYNAPVIFAGTPEKYKTGIEKTKDLLDNYVAQAQKGIKDLPENKYSAALKDFLELLKDV